MAHEPSASDSPIQLQGHLLLADPSLKEATFHRTVILLAEHSAEAGAFGLVLNRPTGNLVGDLLPGDKFAPLRHLPVHDGGPVSQNQLTFSSLWWSPKKGFRWSARLSAEEAVEHARKPQRLVRAFIGYSGWTAGQLENELRRNSWLVTRAEPDLLAHTHDASLWPVLLRRISPLHRILAEAPDDPTLN